MEGDNFAKSEAARQAIQDEGSFGVRRGFRDVLRDFFLDPATEPAEPGSERALDLHDDEVERRAFNIHRIRLGKSLGDDMNPAGDAILDSNRILTETGRIVTPAQRRRELERPNNG